jgi:hypothetical protein
MAKKFYILKDDACKSCGETPNYVQIMEVDSREQARQVVEMLKAQQPMFSFTFEEGKE